MNILCEVVSVNGRITKESIAKARARLAEGLSYAEDKILAELASKQTKPGDIVGFQVGMDIKFGVIAKEDERG